MQSLDSWSDLPLTPPYGSNWGHKIADFMFLRYISFIIAFRALECFKRYWETLCEDSKLAGQIYPLTPLMGQTGVIK